MEVKTIVPQGVVVPIKNIIGSKVGVHVHAGIDVNLPSLSSQATLVIYRIATSSVSFLLTMPRPSVCVEKIMVRWFITGLMMTIRTLTQTE